MEHSISLRGVRLRNLKNIDVDFPIGKISVVCGPSGCGKSTLVMDVLHGESRRRYLETLSPFALKILGGNTNIPLDSAEGLRPSLAISASRGDAPSKSTPLSLSECESSLRIIWAALAKPACPKCGKPMQSKTREDIIAEICNYPENSRLQFLSKIETGKLTLGEISTTLLSQGYARVIADGESLSLGDLTREDLSKKAKEIFVVLDRVIIRKGVRTRIAEAVDATLRFSHTRITIDDGKNRKEFSTVPVCLEHGIEAEALSPIDFSPYSLKYRCRECGGNGETESGEECPKCHGLKLSGTILATSFNGISWGKILSSSFSELSTILPKLFEGNIPEHLKSTEDILFSRINAVKKLGLGYLTTGRNGDSLSGGELQRLRLSPLATGHLDGMCICLDEPASGLYKTDVEKLWKILEEIKGRDNTLVLIEHNPILISRADKIIEMGPGAGELGGEILFQGTPAELMRKADSPTGKWLNELSQKADTSPEQLNKSTKYIEVKSFAMYDMETVCGKFPVKHFSVITGESGSGKSTLLFKHILPRFEKGEFEKLGIENISELSAKGFFKNRRSTIASAIEISPALRDLFARLPESKIKGYSASKFNTTVPGGRCETCKGEGVLRDPSGYEESECPVCLGKRFRDEVLEVRFKTLSFADILDLSVERASTLLSFSKKFSDRLKPLARTGLSYLRLGQSTTHLSGGETARIKLSQALAKAKFPKTLFLFDEPARGLHKKDIDLMLGLIQELCKEGHTVIAIEHQEDFIRAADYTLELHRK